MKVTCVPNACFKFWHFTVNAFFFSSLVVAHVCTFPSKQRFKKFTSPTPKWSHFAKIVLLKLNFHDEGQLSANCLFYCFSHFAWNFFFSVLTAWKVSKYGVISGPYFPVFGLNTGIDGINLRIYPEYRKIQTKNNSVFGFFSCSVSRGIRMHFLILTGVQKGHNNG